MKVGLVLEGGALRGLYTAGVLDTLMDNNINIDGIIGVSAGALFGVNYFSNQKGRVLRYSLKYSKNLRYMSILSYLLTGNVVNKNFAYYKVSNNLDKFDNETFIKNNKDFYLVASNIESGLPEYIKITNPLKEMELLRATSAIPFYTKIVDYDNKKYLDGAITDSIPYEFLKSLGYDKIVIILTRDIDYIKPELSDKQIKKIKNKYKRYPNFINALINRPKVYNAIVNKILIDEKNNDVFVIRPSKQINIKTIERNNKVLKSIYDLGIKDANNSIDKLKKYIKAS